MVAVRRVGSFVASGMLVALGACGTSSQATPTADAAVLDGGSPKKDGGFLDLDAGARADTGVVLDDAGWATLDGFACAVKYAATAAALPPPIHWVDCPASFSLPGACKRIALDFPDLRNGIAIQRGGAFAGASGVEFTFRIFHPSSLEWWGVDGNNQVRVALRSANLACTPGGDFGPAEGRYALGDYVNGRNAAVVAGSFSGQPSIFRSYQGNSSWYALTSGIVERNTGLALHPWDRSAPTVLSPPGTDASRDLGQLQEVAAVGALPARIYASSGYPFHVYEYASGTPRKIVTGGRDAINEVGSFAVSRDRIFWTNVEAIPNSNFRQETALYTQELDGAGALKGTRKRLPSPSPIGYSQSARLGCDILARGYLDPLSPTGVATGGGLEVFDFRTMRHWRIALPGNTANLEDAFGIQTIEAVSCTEVIAGIGHIDTSVSNAAQQNFARFDLSKLGPGEAFAMTPDPVP